MIPPPPQPSQPFDNGMPTETVHTAYLNLNDLSEELYGSIVNSEFSHAVEVSKNILESNNAWIVSDVVSRLAQESSKNLTSYAYKLWHGGQSQIVLDCLPPAFKTIFNEDSVTLVDKLFNLALKLKLYEYSDGDKEAWGASEDKTSKRVEWKLIPVWKNNKVLFKLKNIDCVKFLKLEVGQDSAGDRGAFGSPSDKSDTVRHEWFLEPVTINGEILFFIINKQFSQGLKLAMSANYDNDRRLWGHRGDVHGDPSRFAWSIKKYSSTTDTRNANSTSEEL